MRAPEMDEKKSPRKTSRGQTRVAVERDEAEEGYLDGQMLVAMPVMEDERFARSVIYICAHSAEGAMGIIVNRPAGSIDFPQLLVQLDIIDKADEIRLPENAETMKVLRGGPVETEPPQQLQQPRLDLPRPAGRVLGLDRQLDMALRAGHQFEQPLQGQHAAALGRVHLPVRRLIRVLEPPPLLLLLPRPEVQRRQVGELQGGDRAAPVGRTVDTPVVYADQMAVGGEADVTLQCVRPVLDGLPVGGQGVFGDVLGRTAVGHDLDGAGDRRCIPCRVHIGHAAMVPPSGAEVRFARCKERRPWCGGCFTAVRHGMGKAVS